MNKIPEIPMNELQINSWNPIRTGFVVRQDTHVSITHLATRIYVEASDERSVHRARAVAMEKFEKAWSEYWSKPAMNSREAMREAFEARVKEQCAKNGANEAYINAVLCKDELGNYINIGTWQRFDDFCDVWQAALASQPQQQNAWQQAIDDELVNAHLGIAKDGITREEAKAELNKLIAWHIDVAKYFESQAQQSESQWVSVDERLPEAYKPVLVATNFGDVYTCRLPVIIAKNSKEESSVGKRERFTHWMPLPPAPEGDKK